MLADAKQGDVIIAAKLDRLFRSTRDAINTAAMLKERGVDLILADLGTDPVTGNGAGKLFFGILAMVAEFERERIQERTNDGRKSKFARGGHLGGSPPYGFKVVGSGREATLQEIPEEQDTIRKIRRLINEHTPASACRTALQMGLRDRAGSPFRIGQMQRIASRYVGINDIYEENGVAVRG
jgi:DNA invertase Pin-like site-specific DNA recombinase